MKDYTGYESLRVEVSDSGVITATLDRPERLNAFDGGLRHSIRRILHEVGADDDARVFVLTGAGRGFCSGADLTAEDKRGWPQGPAEPLFAWCLDLLEMPKPTISAINGVAAGGGLGLALLCDIRIATTNARLIPIWMKRAIHPDDLITWTLPKAVGYNQALKWLYLGEDIPLDEAEKLGLLQDVVEPDQLASTTTELAERLASGPTKHLAMTKQAVLKGLNREPWDAATMESWGQDQARASEDFLEGVAAFRDRRDPVFRGR